MASDAATGDGSTDPARATGGTVPDTRDIGLIRTGRAEAARATVEALLAGPPEARPYTADKVTDALALLALELLDVAFHANGAHGAHGTHGTTEAADAVRAETTEVYRRLAAVSPGKPLADVAHFYHRTFLWLLGAGRDGHRPDDPAHVAPDPTMALDIAHGVYDRIGRQTVVPLAALAFTLGDLVARIARPHLYDLAVATVDEAVEETAEAFENTLEWPGRGTMAHDLADGLLRLSGTFDDWDRAEESLLAARLCVAVRRWIAEVPERRDEDGSDDVLSLVELDKRTDRLALARDLQMLAVRLEEAGAREEALAAQAEAVEWRRRTPAPGGWPPEPSDQDRLGLALALNDLACHLGRRDRWSDALTAIEEALGIDAELGPRPDAARQQRVRRLTLAEVYEALGRDDEAAELTAGLRCDDCAHPQSDAKHRVASPELGGLASEDSAGEV